MHLIQILLPLTDNDGSPYSQESIRTINAALTERFGGVTAFSRAPARGYWKQGAQVERDDVIIVEVMSEALDRSWWDGFRRGLETDLRQEEIVIRAHLIERL